MEIEEQRKATRDWTFKPEINKNVPIMDEDDVPVEQRLYEEGMEKKRRKLELSRLAQDEEKFTFHPEVKESLAKLRGEKAFEEPIYKRWDQIQK